MKKILIIMMGLYILIPLKAYAVGDYSQQLDEITEEYNQCIREINDKKFSKYSLLI
mgnify:CR=1 FL=1